MDPLVSAVVRTYNREGYVREAIKSVLSQTYKNLEVVVVDVGSTDNTPNLLGSFGNKIRHHRYDNRNHLAAMNFAVEKAVAVVGDNPELSVVSGRWRCVLDAENEVFLKENPPIACKNRFARLLSGNCVQSCGVLVEKRAILAVGG